MPNVDTVPSIKVPGDKYITSINQKNADGSFTSYPIGAKGENVILRAGINLEKKLKNIDIELSKGNLLYEVILKQADWVGTQPPYTQTVLVEGMIDRSALLVSLVNKNSTAAEFEEYSQNFAMIANGYAETSEGQVDFKVYNKPTKDIEVGIVLGTIPLPADVDLWMLDSDDKHATIRNANHIARGGAEPVEGKDLVTVNFLNSKALMKTGGVMSGALHVTGKETDIQATTDGKITFQRNTTPSGSSKTLATRSIVQNATGDLEIRSGTNGDAYGSLKVGNPTSDMDAVNRRYISAFINHNYEGRDISNYYDWADLKQMCDDGDFSDLVVGDYKTITLTGGKTVKCQIAGIDTYYKSGNPLVKHHIDFISKDCLEDEVKWNNTNKNNGTVDEHHPYLVSNVHTYLINNISQTLPAELSNIIVDKHMLMESRYSADAADKLTTSIGWDWVNLGKLWLPTEYEIFGSTVWGTKGWSAGQAIQYPLFANNNLHRIKGKGNDGANADWWLCTIYSGNSTSCCLVSSYGLAASYGNASDNRLVPLCFRIEAA